jgi:hypothetical protein
MLTGKRLFEGATASDTLAAVLKSEPDWTALPADTPAPIRRLLRRCLDKDRKRRLDSAAAARLDIDEALTSPADGAAGRANPESRTTNPVPRLAWMTALAVAAVVVIAFAVLAGRYLRETLLPETRVDIITPATDSSASFELSPDGRQIVSWLLGIPKRRSNARADYSPVVAQ